MANTYFTGFESGNSGECQATAGTFSVQGSVTAGAWSAYALRVNPSGAGTGSVRVGALTAGGAFTNPTSAKSFLRAKFRVDTLPASADEDMLWDGGLALWNLRLNSAGNLVVYDPGNPGTPAATGTAVLSAGVWYRVEAKVDVSDTVNVVWEVKVDGTADVSGSYANGGTAVAGWRLGKVLNSNGNSVDYYYDDVSYSDSAYPGDGRCKIMVPAANGSYASGTPAGSAPAASLWQSVKEVPHDSDTTVINAIGNGNACTFTLTASGASSGDTINGVKGVAFIRRDGATNGNMKLRVRSSSTDSDTTGLATTASYQTCQKLLDTDPGSGSAWTQSSVDAAEVGVVENSANADRVTATYLMVDYVPSGAPPAGSFNASWAKNNVLLGGGCV